MLWIFWNYLYSLIYGFLFPIEKIGQVHKISYYLSGRKYSLYVPISIQPQTKVFLIKDGKQIDISQPAGVPYSVCAKDFAGEKIIVCGLDTDKIFDADEIPCIEKFIE